MSGFLSKLKNSSPLSRSGDDSKVKLPLRDPDDPRILYILSPRSKKIALKVKPSEREATVSIPNMKSLKRAMRFVREQKDWVEVQLEALPPAQPFTPDAPILFEGEIYRLVHPGGRGRPKVNRDTREIVVPAPDDAFSGRVRRLLIREARERLTEATLQYADAVGRPVGKIQVRDTSSRWGSCITRGGEGHISYSWRLISAPPFVLDYVAAHECAHMIEDNHSAAYWAVVDSIFPDYKRAKKWLRANGAYLHAVGAEI